MRWILGLLLVSVGLQTAQAAEREKVKLPDSVQVEGKTLNLNGRLALRKVHRFGIPVKVYVGGLYTEKPNKDSEALLKNDEIKRIIMHYMRTVDRDALVDAFRESYEATCVFACETKKEQFKQLAQAIVSLRQDNEIIMTFYKDKLEVETTGPNAKKETIADANVSRNTFHMYVSPKAIAGKEFRDDILGL